MALPYTPHRGGLRLAVRVTPRASRTALAGVSEDADGRAWAQVRLHAPPVNGAANEALIAFLAKQLSLKKADIEIQSGATGRLKVLLLRGDTNALTARVAAWIGD